MNDVFFFLWEHLKWSTFLKIFQIQTDDSEALYKLCARFGRCDFWNIIRIMFIVVWINWSDFSNNYTKTNDRKKILAHRKKTHAHSKIISIRRRRNGRMRLWCLCLTNLFKVPQCSALNVTRFLSNFIVNCEWHFLQEISRQLETISNEFFSLFKWDGLQMFAHRVVWVVCV